MPDMTDAELDRLVERLERKQVVAKYASTPTTASAGMHGRIPLIRTEVLCNPDGNEAAAAITALRARIAELEVEVEVANGPSPYCPICGSCGEDGCCSAQRCLYSDDKLMARIAELEADRAGLVAENARLREAIKAYRKLLMPIYMAIAERGMIGEPLSDDSVLFSFMGSGASDNTTVGDFRKAESAARAALKDTRHDADA